MAKTIITRSSLLWSPNNAYCVVIDMKQEISESLNASKQALDDFISNDENIEAIAEAAKLMIATLQNGNAIYSCGNGGSMSDAMHFAEMLGSSEEFWRKFGDFDYIDNLKNDSLIGLGKYLIDNIVDKTNEDPEAEAYRTGINEHIEMMKISNRRFMAREGLKFLIFGALHKYTERGVG